MHTDEHHERGCKYCKLCICAHNPICLNYTKSRIFAVLVSENSGKTLFRTYKKSLFGLFGGFGHLREGAKGGEGGGLHGLNT